MLFKDILDNKYRELAPEFDDLLKLCNNNQTHPGDLLLIHQNGFYNPDVHNWTNVPIKLSPYVMGPGSEINSEDTHCNFIGKYVNNNINKQPSTEYFESVKYDSKRMKEINILEDFESYTIQTEMLIYLKIWESDAFIKRFYQFVRIINGNYYDWHFKIQENPSDNTSTGSRGNIIRNDIRNKLKKAFPRIHKAFNIAYKSQVRNAIAHSQYIIIGRSISLNNYNKDHKFNILPSVPFNDWIDIFHETIVLHSLYNKALTNILHHYEQIAVMNDNRFEIRINKVDPIVATEYRTVEYNSDFKYWK